MVGACRGELSFLVSSEPLPSLSYRLVSALHSLVWTEQLLSLSLPGCHHEVLGFPVLPYHLLWVILHNIISRYYIYNYVYSAIILLLCYIQYLLRSTCCYTVSSPSAWFIYFIALTVIMTLGLLTYFLFRVTPDMGTHIWAWFMYVTARRHFTIFGGIDQ